MNPPASMVVGTAGHIDHGKSSLVRALTGIDPDRLKEEQERGITIDLGFAHLSLDETLRLGFVDVPGHERFVRNMLAGVGGIDLVLLVIAADESIKPQTREHFDICRLLAIPRGIVVLTKADLVEPDMLELVRLEAREFTRGSFLEKAPIVAVSARTSQGLEDLRGLLRQAARGLPARPAAGLARLPIDRAFSIKGFGTVVTGTLIAGTLREGQEVTILPQAHAARIRGLQTHNETTPSASPGRRVAVNLQGIDTASIDRGTLLTEPGILAPTHLLDVRVDYLPAATAPLRDLSRVGLHIMTTETPARLKLVGGGVLRPGGAAFGQLRTERPVVALPGDRFILRRQSPAMTIGGGVVLHNNPPKLRGLNPALAARYERLASPEPAGPLRLLVEEAGDGGIDAATLRSRTGLATSDIDGLLAPIVRDGKLVALPGPPRRYLSTQVVEQLRRAVKDLLAEFHRKEPLHEGLAREEIRTRVFSDAPPDVFRGLLAGLASEGVIRVDKDRVALASHRVSLTAAETAVIEGLETAFREGGTNPPEIADIARRLGADPRRTEKLLHLLLASGRLVRIPDGKVFHAEAIHALKRRLWERRAAGATIDIGEFKDLSGTSRKNAIPLLEHFDQTFVTRRDGNRRIILPPPPAPAAGGD